MKSGGWSEAFGKQTGMGHVRPDLAAVGTRVAPNLDGGERTAPNLLRGARDLGASVVAGVGELGFGSTRG